MRSRTPEDLGGRCPACYLPRRVCLCSELPRVYTRFELLVVRHAKETHKSTNTARLAGLALPSCRILPYGLPGQPFDATVLEGEGSWLLFPGATPPPPGTPAPRRLVVLDGNWSQVRRMLHRMPLLERMPGLSLPPPAPHTRRLRRPPHPEGMSTLEAIAGAVAVLEGEQAARPLYALHEQMVERVLSVRGRLSG